MRCSKSVLVLLVPALSLAACSYFPSTENDYRNSRSRALLKPPEGVVIPRPDRTYRVPELPDESSAISVEEPPPVPPAKPATAGAVEKPAQKPAESKQAKKPVTKVKQPVADKGKSESGQSAGVPVFVTRQDLTHRMERKKPAATQDKKAQQSARKIATEKNSFDLLAPPEKVWPRLVAYWMHRGIPLIESNPESGKILTDWVQSTDPAAQERGVRDQFQVTLERSKQGSRVTLVHKASRKASIKGDSEWTLLGSNPAIQGTETVRLRSYLTGK